MKNILIMGIGRAGKTTLSEMIKNKYPNYNLVHSDSIKWALIRAAGKEKYYRTNIKEQKEFAWWIYRYVFFDEKPNFKGKSKLAWILVEPILTKSKNKSNLNQNETISKPN